MIKPRTLSAFILAMVSHHGEASTGVARMIVPCDDGKAMLEALGFSERMESGEHVWRIPYTSRNLWACEHPQGVQFGLDIMPTTFL